MPTDNKLVLVNRGIEQKKIDIQNKEDYIKDIKEKIKEVEAKKDQFDKIASALPEGVGVPAIFDFLQRAASQSGMVLKDTDADFFASSSGGSNVKESNVSFSLMGSYQSFKNFLSAMEYSARLFEVNYLTFSPVKEEMSLRSAETSKKEAVSENSGIFEFKLQAKVRSY
ncbi:hypothetical protein BWK69_00330 [Candidatus Parcubacteria bacterium A4]|nr:MAG: hypothetical protein BWK69_00330 [Candidatus Parcubacteria bacterium A4]